MSGCAIDGVNDHNFKRGKEGLTIAPDRWSYWEGNTPLAKLDLIFLLEVHKLPSHEGIVKWVGGGCDEGPSPIDFATKHLYVCRPFWRKVLEPLFGLCKSASSPRWCVRLCTRAKKSIGRCGNLS